MFKKHHKSSRWSELEIDIDRGVVSSSKKDLGSSWITEKEYVANACLLSNAQLMEVRKKCKAKILLLWAMFKQNSQAWIRSYLDVWNLGFGSKEMYTQTTESMYWSSRNCN